VGGSLFFEMAVALTEWPPEIVGACARRTGDLGEALALLLAGQATARPGLPLARVARLFEALAESGTRLTKRRLLDDAFRVATPIEAKYLAKAILGGELRIGAQGGVLEGAIARAFSVDVDAVRRAGALVTDPGALAVLAKEGRLAEAKMTLGRPVAYMLATPMETLAAPVDPALFVLEPKLDGIRAQLHKTGDQMAIFARGLDDVSRAFPEVADAMRLAAGSFALDGELVAVMREGADDVNGPRPRPFMALQRRLNREEPSPRDVEDTPVAFFAFDWLADEGGDRLAEPWTERRARLEAFAVARGPHAPLAFFVNPVFPLPPDPAALEGALDTAFERARGSGHEGLVLKKKDAPTDAGRRGQAWVKVKRAFATLDCVVTAAEEGHGRRAGVLSDYTFGVWHEGEVVNVGKAYSGLSDHEIERLGKDLVRLTVGRYGRVRAIAPEIVLEVAFDGIQRSTRHKSGFALRFPRIVRVRSDKTAPEADRLEAVEALFRAQLGTGHREDPLDLRPTPAAKEPRARRGAKRANDARPAQLSLFDDRKK
jgi:DNA ligase-1